MKTIISLLVALCIIIGLGYFFINPSTQKTHVNISSDATKTNETEVGVTNSVIENGIQVVTIKAKDGYTPRKSVAQAGVPTLFSLETDRTYDCSASIVINSLNVRRTLPNTGTTLIDAGVRSVGDVIEGVCSMGMYSFSVEFK